MLVLVDDFFLDPDRIRSAALKQKYSNKNPHFPGFRSEKAIRTPEIRQKVIPLIQNLDDSPRFQKQNFRVRSCFQYMTAKDRKAYIHTDSGYSWSGIIFLNPDRSNYPGTSFYKHKLTGLDKLTEDSVENSFVKTGLFKSPEAVIDQVIADRFKFERWEHLFTAPAKYNRLLLFKTDRFHQIGSRWGSRVENARLTFNLFI